MPAAVWIKSLNPFESYIQLRNYFVSNNIFMAKDCRSVPDVVCDTVLIVFPRT